MRVDYQHRRRKTHRASVACDKIKNLASFTLKYHYRNSEPAIWKTENVDALYICLRARADYLIKISSCLLMYKGSNLRH